MLKTLRKQSGFTLMELMVVIVIVAILAAVAVPLYINYVKDAQRTEAKGAIGAVITAEQVYYQQNQAYTDLGTLKTKGLVDIAEVEIKWTVTAVAGTSPPGFTISASNIADNTVSVYYRYNRGGLSEWSNTSF